MNEPNKRYEYLRYSLRLEPEESNVTYCEYRIENDRAASKFLTDICKLHLQASEEFLILAIDAQSKVFGWHRAAIGSVNSVPIAPREVFKFAILANATSLLLAHNHVSGEVVPSDQDRETTRILVEAGRLIGIPVLDHIIIGTENSYFSFKGANLLELL